VCPPGCWRSLRANLSRFTCSFSDHSWDDTCPLFPSAPQLHRPPGPLYARRFLCSNSDCTFQLQTRVVSLRPSGEGGQWEVEFQELGK